MIRDQLRYFNQPPHPLGIKDMNGNTPSYFIKITTLTKLLKMNSAKIP